LAEGGGDGTIRRLAALIEAKNVQRSSASTRPGETESRVCSGWDAVDRALTSDPLPRFDTDALAKLSQGGLARGAIHEWLCDECGNGGNGSVRPRWQPSHSLFIHLACRAVEHNADDDGLIIWVGRRVWPYASSLWRTAVSCHDDRLIVPHRSIFIDPPDDASRLWAIDLALRSAAANVVIADGSRLKMAESRRLQLAAERGRTLALLARPAWEKGELSAASTRWRVRRSPSSSSAPRWIVELLRCKQAQGRSGTLRGDLRAWEIGYVSPGHLRLVADVVDRSDSQGAAPSERRRAQA